MKSKKSPFDSQAFLDTVAVASKVSKYRTGESIFSQGDSAVSVMYIRSGGVKFSIVNFSRREAVVAVFGPRDFFGEGCMAGELVRRGTATAVAPTTILAIGKNEMLRGLHAEHRLSEYFIEHMIARNIRIVDELVAHLCDSGEKRLARTLLMLAGYGKQKQPNPVLPNVSQETLGKMIGLSRSRVNICMRKFRKRGYVKYNGKIEVNKSLLTVVLDE